MSRLVLKGGRLLDPSQRRDETGDVAIEAGRVVSVGGTAPAGGEVIDCAGAWVTPGLVDLHSVVRDVSDLEAAARGGFTAVVAAPESTLRASATVRLLEAAPLTRNLEGVELGDDRPGAVCLSQGFKPLPRAGVLRRALQYAAGKRLLVVHAEDPSLTGGGVIGESLTATRLGIPAVPASAEASIVARDLELLAETGGRLHFAHLTTARSVELVRAARARGLPVTCDVTPHHLTRDATAAEGYALAARVWPPLRTPGDLAALRAGLVDGTIDAIACDHVKVEELDREHAFEACSPGCEAFEAALPAAFSLDLTPARLVEVLSTAPARLVGLPSGLVAGAEARLSIIDPRRRQARGVICGSFFAWHGAAP